MLGIDEFLDDMLKADPEHPKLEKVPKLLDDALSEYPHKETHLHSLLNRLGFNIRKPNPNHTNPKAFIKNLDSQPNTIKTP